MVPLVKRPIGPQPRWRASSCFVLLALVAALAAVSTGGPEASQQPTGAAAPLRQLDSSTRQTSDDPTDRGATYYWLEGQAKRVTTRFTDAIAVADRDPQGDFKTRLTDLAGNELATFAVDRMDSANDVLEFKVGGASRLRAAGGPQLRPTLDWGNRQVYSLWKDLPATGDPRLEWRDTLMRPRRAPARDVEAAIVEIRTDWPEGLSAITVKGVEGRRNVLTGQPLRGHFFVGRLRKHDVEVGFTRWDVEERVLSWSFPGLTKGYLDSTRLERAGGWPFVPDMAWANIQAFAFHHFHSLVASQGFVAKRHDGWMHRIAEFVAPTLSANEPGCDGLHWLDRTLFRPCCDQHDRCYEKSGCGWSSWWQWWSSWQCNVCNATAVFCFGSGGWPPYYPSPY